MTDTEPDMNKLGPYRILRKLGEGAKGQVYEAEQLKPVRRTVALKILRSGGAAPEDALRFAAEQQALALMDHPGIAKVFDAGIEADGRQWFAMELVDGQPLIEFADRQQLDMAARIRLLTRVCRAVQHAHQKGVIHRDLKPGNVLVALEDGEATPKVIDFGIAKAVGLRLTEETLLTQFGSIIGTPAYMSPEQAEGTVFAIDTRADVYSLGVMMYELLVGSLPVDPRISGYPDFIAYLKDANREAPTPATRLQLLPAEQQQDLAHARGLSPAQHRDALAGDLRWIVTTALAKDPVHRYQSAAAMADDLEHYSRGEAISARSPTLGYQLRKFVGRNRSAVAATFMVVVALVAGTIAATIGMLRAEREAQTASTVSEFLESMFAEADPFTRSGGETTARELLDRAADKIASDLGDQPVVQGRLMSSIGAAYGGIGQYAKATPLLEEAIERLQNGNATDLQIIDAKYELGRHLAFISEYERSQQLLDEAIDYYRKNVGYADPRLAAAISDRVFNGGRSRTDEARTLAFLEHEIGPVAASLGSTHRLVGQLHYQRCWLLRNLGRSLEALDACRQSLAKLKEIHRAHNPIVAINTHMLGLTLQQLARFEEALVVHEQALAYMQELYGTTNRGIALVQGALARSHSQLGDWQAALAWADHSLTMMNEIHDRDNTDRIDALYLYADILTALRRFAEAGPLYAEMLERDAALAGPRNMRIGLINAAWAEMLLQQGMLDNASDKIAMSLDILTPGGDLARTPAGVLVTAGHIARRRGEFETAEALLNEAHDRAAAVPGNAPFELAITDLQLAALLFELDRIDEACTHANTARDSMQELFGADRWQSAAAETAVGTCLVQSGDVDAGRAMLAEGIARLELTLAEGDIYLADARAWAAELAAESL